MAESMQVHDVQSSAAAPTAGDEAAEALKKGPRGALVISAIAVGLLFIGWMVFYFLLFMPRGPIG